MNHKQHDAMLAEMAARAERRGVPFVRPPEAAIPTDVYPEPAPLLPPPEPLDLTKGRSGAEEDAWEAHQGSQSRVDRCAEREAVDELDRLRLEALERDAVEVPKLSREPVRPDPRRDFLSQSRG